MFLGQSVPYSTMKHRTVFYEALTRLLTIDLNDDEQLFEQFMQPLAGLEGFLRLRESIRALKRTLFQRPAVN